MSTVLDNLSRKRTSMSKAELNHALSAIETFYFQETPIRVATENGVRMIVLADVSKALGYQNSNDVTKKIPIGNKCRLEIGLKNTLAVCTDRQGLYIFARFSTKPRAMELYYWAFGKIFSKRTQVVFEWDAFVGFIHYSAEQLHQGKSVEEIWEIYQNGGINKC